MRAILINPSTKQVQVLQSSQDLEDRTMRELIGCESLQMVPIDLEDTEEEEWSRHVFWVDEDGYGRHKHYFSLHMNGEEITFAGPAVITAYDDEEDDVADATLTVASVEEIVIFKDIEFIGVEHTIYYVDDRMVTRCVPIFRPKTVS